MITKTMIQKNFKEENNNKNNNIANILPLILIFKVSLNNFPIRKLIKNKNF